MKEMNWTREEALKRMAFLYKDTQGAMEHDACRAATSPMKRIREKLFENAIEKSYIMTGILMAASAIGIEPDEVVELEFDQEEKYAFMKEFAAHADELGDKDSDEHEVVSNILSGLFG